MNTTVITKYHLLLLMDGVPDFLLYEVDEETQERLKYVLGRVEDGPLPLPFFAFMSKDGCWVIVSVKDIQAVNFLWEHQQVWATYGGVRIMDSQEIEELFDETADNTSLTLYLRGRSKPFKFYSSHPGWLRNAVERFELMQGSEDAFVSFFDEDDEMLAFRASQTILMMVPVMELAGEEEEAF